MIFTLKHLVRSRSFTLVLWAQLKANDGKESSCRLGVVHAKMSRRDSYALGCKQPRFREPVLDRLFKPRNEICSNPNTLSQLLSASFALEKIVPAEGAGCRLA